MFIYGNHYKDNFVCVILWHIIDHSIRKVIQKGINEISDIDKNTYDNEI